MPPASTEAPKLEENKHSKVAGGPSKKLDSISEADLEKNTIAFSSSENSAKFKEREAPAPSMVKRSVNNKKLDADEVADTKEEPKDIALIVVDEPASFRGGDLIKFKEYVSGQLKNTNPAKKPSVSGAEIVQFVIGKNGKVTDIKILRSLGAGYDKELINILRDSPRWDPAKQNGKIVKQQFELSIGMD
jgi:protein TonB